MKWYRNYLLAASVAMAALLAIGWTQNSTSDWFKGIIYAGSSKKQLTDSSGNLLVAGTGAFSANVTVSGTLAVSGATSVTGALGVTGPVTAASGMTVAGTFSNSGGPPIFGTAETGLTAHAGGTQAAALALSATKFIHQVTTVGTAADSVALPAPVLGTCHLISNEAAANSMQLFAITPATVNGAATATGIAVAAKKGEFCCATSSTDYSCAGI